MNIKGQQTNTGRTHFKKGSIRGIRIERSSNSWNKGLKGYLSKQRLGEGNPMFGKHHTKRSKNENS